MTKTLEMVAMIMITIGTAKVTIDKAMPSTDMAPNAHTMARTTVPIVRNRPRRFRKLR
jgi:hypothetical protein